MLMELEIKLPWLLEFTYNFRSDVLCLTFHVITQLHLFHLEKLELLMLVQRRLHGIEEFSE